jgi:hypothetical protein
MRNQALAGIARDSCPFCGERVKVSAMNLFPRNTKDLVKCGACGQGSRISGRTRISGGVASMLSVVIVVAITVRTSPILSLVMAALAYPVVGYLVSRLMLRLDPPGLAD